MNTQSYSATFLLSFLAHPIPNYDTFYKAVVWLKEIISEFNTSQSHITVS